MITCALHMVKKLLKIDNFEYIDMRKVKILGVCRIPNLSYSIYGFASSFEYDLLV